MMFETKETMVDHIDDKHDDPSHVISELIHQIRFGLGVDRMGTWSDKLEGIRLLDLHILKLAAKNPNIILGEIRDALDIPHSTLTCAINRLEDHNLLNREISPRDRRSFGLKLTEKGWEIREEHERVDGMIGSIVLDALDGDKEKETLIRLLDKIYKKLR
jgi:DNA-binding MarR family transcriptional regulator